MTLSIDYEARKNFYGLQFDYGQDNLYKCIFPHSFLVDCSSFKYVVLNNLTMKFHLATLINFVCLSDYIIVLVHVYKF
jgi:hypothetical protein